MQMYQIIYGLEHDLDVSKYTDSKITYIEMFRHNLLDEKYVNKNKTST